VDEGARIGPYTLVWAFAHLVSGAGIGAECNLCDHIFVEDGVHVPFDIRRVYILV